MLAALSPKFKAQLCDAIAEMDTINVKDVSASAFNDFVQFFYKHEISLTADNTEDVLNLAKQSLVDELVECIKFILDVV